LLVTVAIDAPPALLTTAARSKLMPTYIIVRDTQSDAQG